MPFQKANRRATFALLAAIALINGGSVLYVIDSQQNVVNSNCRANDRQNKILVTLIEESLKSSPHPLSERQKHAVRVFRAAQNRLVIPTCKQ